MLVSAIAGHYSARTIPYHQARGREREMKLVHFDGLRLGPPLRLTVHDGLNRTW